MSKKPKVRKTENELPHDRTVIATVADFDAAVRNAVRSVGVLCPDCEPLHVEGYFLDKRKIPARVCDLDTGITMAGSMRITRCNRCGAIFDPFSRKWRRPA